MLVLSRRESEGLWIDGRIFIKVLDLNGKRVKLGIEAPEEVPVIRDELAPLSRPQVARTPTFELRNHVTEDARTALERARAALTEVAPFIPPNSAADREASGAIASIYAALRGEAS